MWGGYMATIIAEDHPTIRAMNPTTWIKQTSYPELGFVPSLRAFTKQRVGLLALLRPLPKAGWRRTALVTGAGKPRERTVFEYAQWLANHERSAVNHHTRIVDTCAHVASGGEKGRFGLARAPDFARSGVFFVDYTRGGPLRTQIASFTSNGTVADKASEVVILEIGQPFDNHNGGQVAFGPDGYLYIGMGDGGSGGDPQRNGQNKNALLAKLLRIYVTDRTKYRVPSDNPFAAGGGRGEIWAYGLRNPWRFSFDTETGALWLADVGQNAWEEIDLVARGANYGWNIMEATHCYNAARCDQTGLTLPVVEYGHDLGCSVTGGFVDRGSVPDLRGVYVYGDYCSGRIWGLRYEGGRVIAQAQMATSGFSIGSGGP